MERIERHASVITVYEHLWRTADGGVVGAGDPKARQLIATPGQEMPLAEAERLGIIAYYEGEAPKAASQAPNKAAPQAPNKGVKFPPEVRRSGKFTKR
ncbi:MAG: hypothetical protein ACREM3_29880 [Candidatus Rokuibacteriota bacterium]